MSFNKTQLIVFGLIGLVVLILALVLLDVLPGLKSSSGQPTVITGRVKIWGVFDETSDYQTVFANLQTIYPKVTVTYQGFANTKDYESSLLDALAAGQGPDIFMIRNNTLAKDINKIIPVPTTLFSYVNFQNLFPQIVAQDFATQGRIYALPLSIDTLALIYNRDLLDQAALEPPQTWEDLIKDVPALLKTDKTKNISRAAAALGGSRNINNAADILNLLMLQTGTQMTAPDFSKATFASQEGVNALSFYTQFADAKNNAYTWNASLPNSIDMFSQGNLAIIFDYPSAIAQIKARNPFLNLGISAMPQPQTAQKSITYPNYWGLAVSRQSRNPNLAWNIILALTTNTQNAQAYLAAAQKPPALRSLVNNYANDPILNVYAKQILIARDWPETDSNAIAEIFLRAIEAVLSNANPLAALNQAETQVSQIINKRL